MSLTDDGMPVADIAARFGCSEAHVQKLLKLARVSPEIIKTYRNDDLTLECVMAFTVTDDHEAQERVLADFDPERNDARDIRDCPDGERYRRDRQAREIRHPEALREGRRQAETRPVQR